MRSSVSANWRRRSAPGAGGRGLLCLEQLPFTNGGRVGHRAGQLDLGAGKTGSEMIQRPFVAGQKAKLGLDVVHGQLARRLVGFREGPDQAAPAQHERINLKLKASEGVVVEPQLDLGDRQFRAERLVGAPEADVLRDDAVVPARGAGGRTGGQGRARAGSPAAAAWQNQADRFD